MRKVRYITQALFLCLVFVAVFGIRGNAERWCPFGGVEAIYNYLTEGNMPCSLGISNFYILAAVLLITVFSRRSFCGYLCPIGTISDWTRRAAKRLKWKGIEVHPKIDFCLSLLKYVVLGVILYLTCRHGELIFRGFDPCYAIISRHGEDITFWAYLVLGSILFASLLISMPFCRWLCPLASVLNFFSRFGVARVKRADSTCIHCNKCARACPMEIPVDKVEEVTHARCLSCFDCVQSCPASPDTLVWGPPDRLGKKWPQWVLLAVIFIGLCGAVAADLFYRLPSFVKVRDARHLKTADLYLEMENLACRGRANLLTYYLERDDEYELEGYLKLEAWPGPGYGKARVIYDPSVTTEDKIKKAITEPYFDLEARVWRRPPFRIKGYHPAQKR